MKALKKTKQYLLILLIPAMLSACSVGPKPIEYGSDACDYCRMTIVEATHGAEMVTKKGKVYKYDAIECLVQHKREFKADEIKHLLMTDYANPQTLIPISEGTIIRSEAIPSPMGAFLSGFKSLDEAKSTIEQQGGKILSLDEIDEIL